MSTQRDLLSFIDYVTLSSLLELRKDTKRTTKPYSDRHGENPLKGYILPDF